MIFYRWLIQDSKQILNKDNTNLLVDSARKSSHLVETDDYQKEALRLKVKLMQRNELKKLNHLKSEKINLNEAADNDS